MTNVINSSDFSISPSVAAVLAKTVRPGEDEAPSLADEANRTNSSPDHAAFGNDGHRYEDPVIALRLGLRANGYNPVPITAPAPDDKGSGKKPVLDDWWNICATADEATIRRWPRKWSNTGLVCGVLTEAGALVGVDVDVLDESLSQQIEQIAIRDLGPSPLRRVGYAPKFLLAYRVAEPMAKISTKELFLPSGNKAKVEILAKGQQFVAYGIHPDTRRNYEWGDARPDSMPLADLPMVTHEALKNFVDAAEQLILQAGGKGSKSAKRKSGNAGRSDKKPPEWSETEAARIREALDHIPADDRGTWLNVGMACTRPDGVSQHSQFGKSGRELRQNTTRPISAGHGTVSMTSGPIRSR
jgi:hypothetical protein